MSEETNFGSFVMGFTVGALAGAIASLLLAPQTGEETRQVIKEKAIELKDKGAESYEETKHRAEIAYQDALKKADELAQVTKDKA
ncbi:MAG: YtxH domain-containing protein, partial [Anaerolineaceae bacterium]|nr:YtxH domain-containing protein [Anaerolineaceae bacterium]